MRSSKETFDIRELTSTIASHEPITKPKRDRCVTRLLGSAPKRKGHAERARRDRCKARLSSKNTTRDVKEFIIQHMDKFLLRVKAL